jgi:cell division protein FtsQ
VQPLTLPIPRRELRAERPHDPAPSRTAYRLHRLWLTPLFRAVVRTGLPAFALVMAGGWYLTGEGRIERLGAAVAELRRSIEERPEFMVAALRIENASEALAADIRAAVPLALPASSFDLDLAAIRARIEELDAVARAEVRVVTGNVLEMRIEERVPAVVWRGRERLETLDATGHRVLALAARAERADLGLIAGDGADRAVPEALALLAAAGPIAERVRGLVRVGERRWDLELDRGQRILLPEADPVAALERVIALAQAQDLLARDVLAVDLRDGRRPILRLSPGALRELRRIKGLDGGDDA